MKFSEICERQNLEFSYQSLLNFKTICHDNILFSVHHETLDVSVPKMKIIFAFLIAAFALVQADTPRKLQRICFSLSTNSNKICSQSSMPRAYLPPWNDIEMHGLHSDVSLQLWI